MMKRLYSIIAFILIVTTQVMGQKEGIEATINNLFKGMLKGDSSLVHQSFHDDVSMFTTFIDKDGKNQLRQGSLESFLKAVGTPHEEVWNEVISDLKIEVDDGLADAWMNYSFYRGEEFSHCGVNAMQLIKVGEEWKILHLIDTRRKQNCNE